MSYDQWLYQDPGNKGPIKTWEHDHMLPIGTLADVKARLEAVLPGLRWRNGKLSEWSEGFSAGPGYEVVLNKDEKDGIRIVRLRGASMREAIELADKLGLSVFDPQTGEQRVA